MILKVNVQFLITIRLRSTTATFVRWPELEIIMVTQFVTQSVRVTAIKGYQPKVPSHGDSSFLHANEVKIISI